MQVSLKWLNNYIDLSDVDVKTVAETLTNLGLEVEGIETVEPLKGDVVVAKIVSAEQHPDAEKLQFCKVDAGEAEPIDIVCGAPNARAGLKVALARVGSVLPGNFKIKASKIRGVKSFGMLCAEEELGISSAGDGIIELDDKLEIGSSISELYALNDTVLEIGLTPNRADCLGYIGIARDLCAKLGKELKLPSISELTTDATLDTNKEIAVEVESKDDCGRFVALSISDIKNVESPLWLRNYLEAAGMRSVNTVVDVTNFIMLENSQPIHAYDVRDVKDKLVVRRAKDGEKLTTLDEVERTLSANDIVIADAEKVVGLAGVMGGLNSEVKDDTTAIVLEVAEFNPSVVRKTSKKFALHSEASHRFERGVDINVLDFVAKRFATVLQKVYSDLIESGVEVSLPKVSATYIDKQEIVKTPTKVALRLDRIKKIIGTSLITKDQTNSILEGLGFKLVDKTDDRVLFEVPSWRGDIEREIDLIEEVARVNGYDKIPYTLPRMELGNTKENPIVKFIDDWKFEAASAGFSETISFPFISEKDLENFNIPKSHPLHKTVTLANPLVEDRNLLRTSMVFSLVRNLQHNHRHGNTGAWLFEAARNFHETIGQTFDDKYVELAYLAEEGMHIIGNARNDDRPVERNVLAAIIDQPLSFKAWNTKETSADFFTAKTEVLNLLARFGISDVSFKKVNSEIITWTHPGASAQVYVAGKYVGYLGELHPVTAKAYDFDFSEPPVVFELDLDILLPLFSRPSEFNSEISKFPAVTRDIAFTVAEDVTCEMFNEAISKFQRKKNLKSSRIFDVYQGDNIEEGKKSMAFTFSFQSVKKTLTDKEVEKEMTNLLNWLSETLNVEQR